MTHASSSRALEFDLARGSDIGANATVAVLLHGRGSDKHDLMGLRPIIPAEWSIVAPRAPFPGPPWGYGPGFAWYRYVEEDKVVTETLEESLGLLDGFLADLPAAIGFVPARILLGGFSQGGTMSMAYALTRPGKVYAALNFSGFLAAWVQVDESGAAPPPTPIFWGHGTGDPSIPFALAERGRARLRRANAKLVTRDYRIGHWIDAEEVGDAVAMVRDLGA
jgi:phospholipase/carboxylesterase